VVVVEVEADDPEAVVVEEEVTRQTLFVNVKPVLQMH
jgi:hypothetical protein